MLPQAPPTKSRELDESEPSPLAVLSFVDGRHARFFAARQGFSESSSRKSRFRWSRKSRLKSRKNRKSPRQNRSKPEQPKTIEPSKVETAQTEPPKESL
jgi:hypothetical protein